MHKLIEYACDELEELEKKAAKGSMSMAELEYADKLASLKKNLLKGDMLYDEEMSYENGGNRGGSYAYARGRGQNARRDSMGRYSREGGYNRERGYSRAAEDMVERLRDLMEDAPNESARKDIERLVHKMEQM